MVMVSFCWKINFLPSKKEEKKKKIRFIDDVLEINDRSCCILSGPPCIIPLHILVIHGYPPSYNTLLTIKIASIFCNEYMGPGMLQERLPPIASSIYNIRAVNSKVINYLAQFPGT